MVNRFLCIAVLLLAGCAERGPEGEQPNPNPGGLGPRFDVYEAVFRQQMSQFKEEGAKRKTIFYLDIEGKDPPGQFMERFANRAGSVLPGSKKAVKADEVAVMLLVEGIEWRDSNNARVMANAYDLSESRKCGTPYPVEVARKDGKWIVVQ